MAMQKTKTEEIFQNKVRRTKTEKNKGEYGEVLNPIPSDPFNGMDIGINAVPKHSFSEPVGQIKGFPTMLQ